MRQKWIVLFLFFIATTVHSQESLPSHVIVISLDGARPDAMQDAYMPHLDALLINAAYSWTAETVFPPATIPAHASMLTGLPVEEHGITHNDYSEELIEHPTFLSLAAEMGFPTAMIVGKEKFVQFHTNEQIYYEFAQLGDGSVVDAGIERLDEGDTVLFLHFPNPDFFGHSTNWMSETYINELYSTDYQMGRFLDALAERDILDSSLFIITSDHGGHDDEHGSNIPEDMLIPMIIFGYGVDTMTLENIRLTQVASTVLSALDIPIPETMDEPIIYTVDD